MALNRFMQLERSRSNLPDRWDKYVGEIEKYFSLEQIAPALGSESSLVNRTSAPCGLQGGTPFDKTMNRFRRLLRDLCISKDQ